MKRAFLKRRNALWRLLREQVSSPQGHSAQAEAALQELMALTHWTRPQILAGLGFSEAQPTQQSVPTGQAHLVHQVSSETCLSVCAASGRAAPQHQGMTAPDSPAHHGDTSTALSSVFVYGTLMPGERWESVAQQGGEYTRSPATLIGARLADLRPEGYPAIFADTPPHSVHGWLYTYAPHTWAAALPFLDDLEGLHLTPPLYQRLKVEVQTSAGRRPAWAYFYARAERRGASGFHWVLSGRWSDVAQRDLEGPRLTWES